MEASPEEQQNQPVDGMQPGDPGYEQAVKSLADTKKRRKE